jgi:hypothetical protein
MLLTMDRVVDVQFQAGAGIITLTILSIQAPGPFSLLLNGIECSSYSQMQGGQKKGNWTS